MPPLRYVLQALINTLASGTEQFLLVLDDYHLITEPEIHNTLAYLVEHLPPQLHIMLATRADPPLPLSLLRARAEVLEVRTDQLRCTPEEITAFFRDVMGIQLHADIIQEVISRTEGWLVGLQLLGLTLQGRADPADVTTVALVWREPARRGFRRKIVQFMRGRGRKIGGWQPSAPSGQS